MNSLPVIACDSHAAYVSAITAVDRATAVLVVPSMPVKRWVQTLFSDAAPVCYTAADFSATAKGVSAALLALRQTCPDPDLLRTTFSTPDSLMALFYWWRRFPDRAAHIPPDRLVGSVVVLLEWLDAFEGQYQPDIQVPRWVDLDRAYILAGSAWEYQRLATVLAAAGYALTVIQRRCSAVSASGCVAPNARYYRCQTPVDEVRLAMQTVVQQTAHGVPASDMLLVVPSIQTYGSVIEQVAAEYQVPVCGLPDTPLLQTLVGQSVVALLQAIQSADSGAAIAAIVASPLCARYQGQSVAIAEARQCLAAGGDPPADAAALIAAVRAWVDQSPESVDTLIAGVVQWLDHLGAAAEPVSYYTMVAVLHEFLADYVDVGSDLASVRDDVLVYLSASVVSRETSGVPVVSFLDGTGSAPSVLMVLGCDQDAVPRFESPTYLGRLIDEPDCVARYQGALAYYSECPADTHWFSYAVGDAQLAPSGLFDASIAWELPVFQRVSRTPLPVVLPDAAVPAPSTALALSATALDAYSKCPQLYYYRYVLRLAGMTDDRLGVLWGVIVHRVVHVFLSGLSAQDRRLLATQAAQLRPALVAAVEGVLSGQSWPVHAAAYARREWLNTGLVDAFLACFESMGLAVFQTEYAFELVELAGGATVSGSIDCILEDPQTGALVVVDFKTGSTVPSKKGSVTGKYHQLAVYVHAAQACFPDRVVAGACFWHVQSARVEPVIVLADAVAKSTVFKGFRQRMHALDGEHRLNQQRIWSALVAAIAAGNYGATAAVTPAVCAQCAYQFMCSEVQ